MRKIATFFVLFQICFSYSAVAGEFEYRAIVPKGSMTCEDSAVYVAERIAADSGANIVWAECLGVHSFYSGGKQYQQFEIGVSYSHTQQISPYFAKIGYTGTPDGRGYSTYEECLNNIAKQNNLFEQETQLKVLVSTCERLQSNIRSNSNFYLSIQGIGTPEKSLHHQALSIVSGSGDTANVMKDGFLKIVANSGGSAAYEYVYPKPPAIFAVNYYSKDSIPFAYWSDHLGNDSICQSQKVGLAEDLSQYYQSVTVPCGYGGKLFVMAGGWIGQTPMRRLEFDTLPLNYLSIDSCLRDKSRQIRRYKQKYPDRIVFSALCTQTEESPDRFQMEIACGSKAGQWSCE